MFSERKPILVKTILLFYLYKPLKKVPQNIKFISNSTGSIPVWKIIHSLLHWIMINNTKHPLAENHENTKKEKKKRSQKIIFTGTEILNIIKQLKKNNNRFKLEKTPLQNKISTETKIIYTIHITAKHVYLREHLLTAKSLVLQTTKSIPNMSFQYIQK